MYLMLVEIKTNGADLNEPQRDLLHIINQLMRTKPWKEQRDAGRFMPGHQQNARIVYSHIAGQKIHCYSYGVHKLRLSDAKPDASDRITWDDKQISTPQLVQILRYDLSPDTLLPLEHRSHKRRDDAPALLSLQEVLDGAD